jgi:hypothetical protein
MANALNEDIDGRYVVLRESVMSPSYRDVKHRVFLVTGGFGASPATRGTALHGVTPIDEESFRMEGHDVERFATDEEITLVHTRWFINEDGGVYDHDMRTQEAAFPNDDHIPYYSRDAAQDAADALMAEPSVFRFLVTVETDTREQAEQVMAERISHDEELGFEYTIDWGGAP